MILEMNLRGHISLERLSPYYVLKVFSQNPYVEALASSVMVFRGGPLGGDKV